MRPDRGKTWRALHNKRVALIGMSGVGKTHLSRLLRHSGEWYHYSVDYRIGTAYLASHIDDDLRRLAMRDPTLGALLRGDALSLHAKFGIDNLDAMSDLLGKIGDTARGGISVDAFRTRQNIHGEAEIAAMRDVVEFTERASSVYGYRHFVCDTSGSFCSVVDPWDGNDPLLEMLSASHVIVYLEAGEENRKALIDRFRVRPKPLYYSEPFLAQCERAYLGGGQDWNDIDPDRFSVWACERLLDFRVPRYEAIAENWGYRAPPGVFDTITDSDGFEEVLANLVEAG